MKRIVCLFLVLAFCLSFSACRLTIPYHEHDWSKWYDNGDGTHTRTCLTDIEHKETGAHAFGDGLVVKQIEGDCCGKRKYTCEDCGFSEVRAYYPSGDHVLDQKTVANKYLYQAVSDYSSIYYLSCACGVYGDESKLFEYNSLSEKYTLLENVKSDGTQYVDLGLSNDGSYYISYAKEQSASRLPAGYTEVEYIEATGTQIINTGVQDAVDITVNCHFYTAAESKHYLFGSTQNEKKYMYNGFYCNNCLDFNWKDYYFTPSSNIVMTQEISGDYVNISVNGDSFSVEKGTVQPTGNIYIFGCNEGNRLYPEELKCYSFQINRNNTAIRDFVPCINSTGEAGLYDLVEGKFYGNDGEGEFEAGAVVSYVSNSRLPVGYTEVEYIESTGAQWIDLGYGNDQGSIFKAKLANTTGKMIFGSHNLTAPYGRQYFNFVTDSNQFGVGYGDVSLQISDSYYQDNQAYKIEFSTLQKNAYLIVDQQKIWSDSSEQVLCPDSYAVFCYPPFCKQASAGRLYYLEIYSTKNEQARSFVPCINSLGKAGLYDLVEGQFYGNSGEGEFLTGSVVSYASNSRLPAGYTEVEYIESTGTQYINTEVNGSDDVGIEITATAENSTDHVLVEQKHKVDGRQWIGYLGSNYYLGWNTNVYVEKDMETKTVLSLNYYNDRSRKMDGEEIATISESLDAKSVLPIYIFSGNFAGESSFPGSAKVYSCRITDGSKLVRDFVPCINSTGEAGLYDLVEGKFYGNDGEGEFETGGVVLSTSSILPDDYYEIEYIASKGAQCINTGVEDDIDITFDFHLHSEKASNNFLFGSNQSRESGDTYSYMYNGIYSNNDFEYNWKSIFFEPATDFVVSERLLDNNNTEIIINGETHSVATGTVKPQGNIYIFACNNGVRFYPEEVRCYYFKIYKNNVIIRDFVPVFCKSKNEVGLYDLVEGKFYGNEGTGEFEAGEAVTYFSALGQSAESKTVTKLPQNYQELSAVTTTQNENLDTKKTLSASSQVSLKFSVHDERETTLLFVNENYYIKVSDYQLSYSIPSAFGDPITGVVSVADTPMRLEKDAVYEILMGIGVSSDGFTNRLALPLIMDSGTDTLRLLGDSGAQSERGAVTVYHVSLYENGDAVADFCPAENKGGTDVGFYDTVADTFLSLSTSAKPGLPENTASFIDTEISKIEIDSRYEKRTYIESTGASYINTGIAYDAGKNMKFVYEISYTNVTSSAEFMGFSDKNWYFIGRNEKNQFVGTPNITMRANRIYAVAASFEGVDAYYSFDGKTYEHQMEEPLTEDAYFTLFAVYNKLNDPASYSKCCRIYSFKEYDDGCLVHYYVPATDTQTGLNGLYDVIEKTFLSSETESNIKAGDDGAKRALDSTINLFYTNNGATYYLNSKTVSFVSVKDKTGRDVRKMIPVIRNADGAVGLLDTVHQVFYASETTSLIAGAILGHDYDDGVIVKAPTYDENGETVYTCALCQNQIHKVLEKTAYRVDFVTEGNITVKSYYDKGDNDFNVVTFDYTRNMYSLNYSKYGATVIFEVVSEDAYTIEVSSGKPEKIKDNLYRITGITEDTTVSIKKQTSAVSYNQT